jgi:hypothetical protein
VTDYLHDGPRDAAATLILAHGAGGAMDTPFMNTFAEELGARGVHVVRFEFPYMAARRTGGKRGAPDRQPVLLDAWRRVVGEHGSEVFIGGKSMGGRMASMVADELGVRGLVCLGYPFHPPGKPDQLRTAHLESLRTPALIVQGTRDPFGTRDEVSGYALSPAIRVAWIEGGDHSYRPREREHLAEAVDIVAEFILPH